jgi:hypothetical protein
MDPVRSLGWGHIPTNIIATRSCSARGIFVFSPFHPALLYPDDFRLRVILQLPQVQPLRDYAETRQAQARGKPPRPVAHLQLVTT